MSDAKSDLGSMAYAADLLWDELSSLIQEGTEYTLGELGETKFVKGTSSIQVPILSASILHGNRHGNHHLGVLVFLDNRIEIIKLIIGHLGPSNDILYCDPDFFAKVVDFVRNL